MVDIMRCNVEEAMKREDFEPKTADLEEGSHQFQRTSVKLKKKMRWKTKKMKLVIGGIAGTILLIIIIVIASEASGSSDDSQHDDNKAESIKQATVHFNKEAIERTPIEAVANANTNFGNALFKILAKPAKNLIMSSYSVSLVLSMALNGAEGTTASQLKQGLTLKDFDVVRNGFKDALKLMKSNENFTLNAANRYVNNGVSNHTAWISI